MMCSRQTHVSNIDVRIDVLDIDIRTTLLKLLDTILIQHSSDIYDVSILDTCIKHQHSFDEDITLV